MFPDYSLPDRTGRVRTLSELRGRDPLILLPARGNYCPEHRRLDEALEAGMRIVVAVLGTRTAGETVILTAPPRRSPAPARRCETARAAMLRAAVVSTMTLRRFGS